MNNTEELIKRLRLLLKEQTSVVVAIDGRCGSGKTTLSEIISERLDCNIIHTDDFFLRPQQKTPERLSEVGGNIDYERFKNEVVDKLKTEKSFSYRPYDCGTRALREPINIEPKELTIIEGSYSCHPYFGSYADLKIFVTAPREIILGRLTKRNPKLTERFINEWIPLEERYFGGFSVEERADIVIDTGK